MIGFRNVDMAELLIHTLTERVAITEGHLFRVAFCDIFFQLSQAAEFLRTSHSSPVFFFFPATRSVYDAVLTWIFRVLILLSPLLVFSPHHLLSFGSRGFDVLRGTCSLFPPVLTITCLRTFAARGITATAGNALSGGRPQKFLPASGQKFGGMCISPLTGGDGCGCLCPRRQGA